MNLRLGITDGTYTEVISAQELPETAEQAPSLAIMVVGENVSLARELSWLAPQGA